MNRSFPFLSGIHVNIKIYIKMTNRSNGPIDLGYQRYLLIGRDNA